MTMSSGTILNSQVPDEIIVGHQPLQLGRHFRGHLSRILSREKNPSRIECLVNQKTASSICGEGLPLDGRADTRKFERNFSI
ncbi:hypothetical protein BRADI_5g10575v3 [Brachypodium distachyon]|uniref:Uncharacterized protein n=1 Tax=Brachypodium distachyon TaxID=15368 RepID=A0A0Q3E4U6_BRADI|nr:hypothetical protein BRADI_5g10575v3 [Brachypodium distachyon]